jgi:hypothetical protein
MPSTISGAQPFNVALAILANSLRDYLLPGSKLPDFAQSR